MADITKNMAIEMMRWENTVDELKLRIRKDTVKKIELDHQKELIDDNIAATEKQIAELENKLSDAKNVKEE